jgi:DNA-binding CsgD family transcriptional regulator
MKHETGEDNLGEAAVLLDVIDDLSPGVLIVTPDLKVSMLNRAARELADEQDAITVVGGRLRIGPNGRQDVLARAVARAAASPAPSPMWTYVTAVERSTRLPVHVYVRGITPEHVVVYLIDPASAVAPDPDLLRSIFRFSPAEIRVVSELLRTQHVEAVAETLSLSVHTVRAHLKNLFAKTGVRRQGELLQLIQASVSCLRRESRNPSFEGCERVSSSLECDSSSDSPEVS